MRKRHVEPPAAKPANDQTGGAVFTISELALRWRVTRHSIAVAIREGRLQAFKPNSRVYRIREAEVLRYEQTMAVA